MSNSQPNVFFLYGSTLVFPDCSFLLCILVSKTVGTSFWRICQPRRCVLFNKNRLLIIRFSRIDAGSPKAPFLNILSNFLIRVFMGVDQNKQNHQTEKQLFSWSCKTLELINTTDGCTTTDLHVCTFNSLSYSYDVSRSCLFIVTFYSFF